VGVITVGRARAALVAALAAMLLMLVTASGAAAAAKPTRDVLFVGNNWDGTADVIDPQTFTRLDRINIVPDKDARLAEIQSDPVAYGFFLGIRQLVGEGHDQFVDDIFSSPDGDTIFVSRPSFADVVAIDLRTRKIVWRVKVEGYRADHMAISADGRRLLVSASTARKVHVIDAEAGRIVAEFPSGDSPHENNFSRDGSRIFHASIGHVWTPLDQPLLDTTKGDRWFEVVDGTSYQVLERIDMGQKLEEAGYPDMSSAVRPMALAPDEQTVYFQVSFFHGFVEYDLVNDRVLRLANLPLSEEAQQTPREEYLLDSAHHGLSMNPEGTKLCAAGTMSDYAAIVRRDTFAFTIASMGEKPYWSTNSGDGRYCFVSFSGDDAVAAISYAEEREVARIPVGDHPQRMRMGKVRLGLLGTTPR
jgi:DNA-binding beta-propeller fold protein YncE